MKQKRYLFSLYLFFFALFIGNGYTMYASRYLGEMGLTNTQIGLTTAVPAFVAIFAQPVWGVLADRSAKKRTTVVVGMGLAALFALGAHLSGGRFLPLLAALTLVYTMTLPASPVSNAIAMEYTKETGADYGPIRLCGTLGYQLSILIAGFLFGQSLSGFYAIYALILLACAVCAALMPPSRGHQHGGKKVPLTVLLKDRRLMLMLALVFLAQVVAQFFNAFFTKYLGDLGVSNSVTGVITTLTVVMEIPFLFFGDRFYRRMSIFKWMWLGLLINGLRFTALSFAKAPVLILLTQLPSVALFACFEFFPVIYLGETMSRELSSSAQSVLQMTSFGLARIVGASVGGAMAEVMGIGMVFRLGGCMLLAAAVCSYVPLCQRAE